MPTGLLNIDSETYHKDSIFPVPSLSNSIAKILIDQSPLHAWMAHPRLNPKYVPQESSRFDLGTAAHDLILEGGTAKICVINPEDYRSKPTKAEPEGAIPKGWTNGAIRAARDQARDNGLVPVLPWDHAAIKNMVEAAHKFIESSELRGIFQQGKPEQTIAWEEDNGVCCRARLDWLTNDHEIILDYKTTNNAEPEAFIRQIGSMGYDMQDAFYRRGMEKISGKRPVFVFLAQEIEPPYACSLVSLSNAYLEIAEAKVRKAIDLWAECVSSGMWPSYDKRIHYAEPAGWQLQQLERQAVNDEIESGDWQT